MNNIDVLILAGGLGTRLQSVVSDRPKAMAEINGRPFLDILIDYLSSFGIRRFILCIGHMAEYFSEYQCKNNYNAEIILSIEKKPLGTGGAVKYAEKIIRSDPFIVVNGDSFCRLDVSDLFSFHKRSHALVSMAVTKRKNAKDYGLISLDKAQRILSFQEKKKCFEQSYVNAGVYVFNKSLLDLIPLSINYSLENELFPSLFSNEFYGYICDCKLMDIGTPDRYKYAQKYFAKNYMLK